MVESSFIFGFAIPSSTANSRASIVYCVPLVDCSRLQMWFICALVESAYVQLALPSRAKTFTTIHQHEDDFTQPARNIFCRHIFLKNWTVRSVRVYAGAILLAVIRSVSRIPNTSMSCFWMAVFCNQCLLVLISGIACLLKRVGSVSARGLEEH